VRAHTARGWRDVLGPTVCQSVVSVACGCSSGEEVMCCGVSV
jgi:hypothetical protein